MIYSMTLIKSFEVRGDWKEVIKTSHVSLKLNDSAKFGPIKALLVSNYFLPSLEARVCYF